LLALSGGAERVAQWAQVQSVVDMVLGVVSIGLAQGVTVLVAQAAGREAQQQVMRVGLVLGWCIAAPVGVLIAALLALGLAGAHWPHGAAIGALAALAGVLAVAGSTIVAYWLGRHQQGRVFWLTVVSLLPAVVVAAAGSSLAGILWAMVATGLVVSGLLAAWLGQVGGFRGDAGAKRHSAIFFASVFSGGLATLWRSAPGSQLLRYLPVGLAIGLASPLSQVLARGEVSAALSWHDAGVMQAIWRSAEWVTAVMAGILSLVYLPRFSEAAAGGASAVLVTQLRSAGFRVLAATGVLLLLVWLNQGVVLTLLYESSVSASDRAVGLFLLGDFLRVGSWVILFGLLASRATWWVTIGEFLSLPLFAALVLVFSQGMSLERAGWLYLLTYGVYLAFNLVGLWSVFRRRSG